MVTATTDLVLGLGTALNSLERPAIALPKSLGPSLPAFAGRKSLLIPSECEGEVFYPSLVAQNSQKELQFFSRERTSFLGFDLWMESRDIKGRFIIFYGHTPRGISFTVQFQTNREKRVMIIIFAGGAAALAISRV